MWCTYRCWPLIEVVECGVHTGVAVCGVHTGVDHLLRWLSAVCVQVWQCAVYI